MNNLKKFRKLNRTTAHRSALYRNMCEALFKYGRIKTTAIKAKEIRSVAEKIITRAKVNNLHNIRITAKVIQDKDILKKLFNEIAPNYADRNGGYTRIIRLSKRLGDGADMAYLELINEEASPKKKTVRKDKAADKPAAKEANAEKPEAKTTDADFAVKADSKLSVIADGDQFKFTLANGDNIILAGDTGAEDAVKADMETFKTEAATAGVEDLDSDEEQPEITGAKYEVLGKDGKTTFRLKSAAGKILATSCGYADKANCLKAIEDLKANIAGF